MSQSKMALWGTAVAGGAGACLLLWKKMAAGKGAKAKEEKHYEFGGPVGALCTMVSLPAVIVFLYQSCNRAFCIEGLNLAQIKDVPLPDMGSLCSLPALGVVSGWILFQVALERLLPGEVVEGVELPEGRGRLKYTMNGHLAFWVSLFAAEHAPIELSWVYDNYLPLAGASVAVSVALSAYLYVSSFRRGALLAEGKRDNPVYDFFLGRELNPRIGSFDLKEFCELRPGLIGWTLINLGMAAKQRELHGHVSGSMALVVALQGLYVWDSLFQERAILTTMDIVSDGFGYMLAFGDLAWVPFTYSLQARYLVDHDPNLPSWALACIAALGVAGFSIFRMANSEKDAFRRNPNAPEVRHLKTMETGVPGKKLLISGWWGLARKINYTGDWLLGLSWSLTTGFGSVITYFYPIYFAVLLIHRSMRDDELCTRKYGKEIWGKYKKHVPYRFIPGVL